MAERRVTVTLDERDARFLANAAETFVTAGAPFEDKKSKPVLETWKRIRDAAACAK